MSDLMKVKGPASYFPSIEKKYGQPVEHWFQVLRDVAISSTWNLSTYSNQSMGWVMVMPMRLSRTMWLIHRKPVTAMRF